MADTENPLAPAVRPHLYNENEDVVFDGVIVSQEEQDPQFEPVIKLTEQVETKTNEEDEEAIFKMYDLLFSDLPKQNI